MEAGNAVNWKCWSYFTNKEHCSIRYSITYLLFVRNCISVNQRFKRVSQISPDDVEFISNNMFSFFSLFLLKYSISESAVSCKILHKYTYCKLVVMTFKVFWLLWSIIVCMIWVELVLLILYIPSKNPSFAFAVARA